MAMSSRPTLEALGALAGVSASTASRALNDHPLISEQTKHRIRALAQEHGYPVRNAGKAAPSDAEPSLAIVMPHVRGRPLPLTHPFFLELFAGIGEAARARGHDVTLSHHSPIGFDDLVAATSTGRAMGVVFLGQGQLHDDFNRLADTGARFVVWGAQLPDQRYRSIGSDNRLGGRRAALHLARLGRRRIVFLGGKDPEAEQRRHGYRDGLEEAGLAMDPELMAQVEFEFESADAAVNHMLSCGIAFDGIVAASDLMALGAMHALRRAGRRIPEEVSIVGYDDLLPGRLGTPALTTVRQDTGLAGRLLVAGVLEPGHATLTSRLSTELVVRGSCGG